MINTSNEYKQYIRESRTFYNSAKITLANSQILNLDNSQIRDIKIDDGVSKDNSFTIGGAVTGMLKLTINNIYDEFSENYFVDAVIRPSIGLQLTSTIETLQKGVYTVDEPKTVGSDIVITAYDNMAKFEKPFSKVTVNFPCTRLQLLQAVCTYCGVSLATVNFTNWDSVIQTRPIDEALTCKNIVGYIAQISGVFARINTNGALELKWYDMGAFEQSDSIDGGTFDKGTPSYASGDNVDGGNFTDYTSGANIDGGTFQQMERYHHIYSLKNLSIATDDVVITGIQVSDNAETPNTVLFGSSGYIVAIENNPLIQSFSDAQVIANSVGAKVVGMRFRSCSTSVQSDPSIEAGDVTILSDRKGNAYNILITNLTYSSGNYEDIRCDAETPSRNSATQYSEQTKTIVQTRNVVKQEISTYDLSVKQLNDLVIHSFGTYRSYEDLPDGSRIEYTHDKPTRAESKNIWKQTANTFTVSNDGGITWRGMDADGNIVVTVLNAIGINAEWINVGTLKGIRIEADNGKIAGMDIGLYGFTKVSTRTVNGTAETFIGQLGLDNAGFDLNFQDLGNTYGAGVNIFYEANGEPILNLYARNSSGLANGNIYLNGQPVLTNFTDLLARVSKMENFLIQKLQYDPWA